MSKTKMDAVQLRSRRTGTRLLYSLILFFSPYKDFKRKEEKDFLS